MSEPTFDQRTGAPLIPQTTPQEYFVRNADGTYTAVPAPDPAPVPANPPAIAPEPVAAPTFNYYVHLADGRTERTVEAPGNPHWIDPDGTSTMIIGVYPR